MSEWPINKPIQTIAFRGEQGGSMSVGEFGITKIEAIQKAGEHSYIPYVRVWKGGEPFAEFCQHALEGVYFENIHNEPPPF